MSLSTKTLQYSVHSTETWDKDRTRICKSGFDILIVMTQQARGSYKLQTFLTFNCKLAYQLQF